MAIRPKEEVELVQATVRIPKPLLEQVELYAKYLGGKSDRSHVLSECAREQMGRDRGFREWLTQSRPGLPGHAPLTEGVAPTSSSGSGVLAGAR